MSSNDNHNDNKKPLFRFNTQGLPEVNIAHSRDWMRDLNFGDYHNDTHEFLEHAATRIPKEVGCAFAASFLVSPIVAVIDKCIVQDINGTAQFVKAMATETKVMFTQPRQFLGALPFRLTFVVYFGTYAVANLSELVMDKWGVHDDDRRKTIKVAAASPTNVGLLAWRDAVFAHTYAKQGGAAKSAARTPLTTLGLFAARDSATMYATFYAAPQAALWMQDRYGTERNVSELSMALAIPMVTQFVTAPWHIYAMDLVGRPQATMAERMECLKTEFNKIAFARGLRILPAFGIGSFSNNKFRELFIRQPDEEKLLTRKITRMVTRFNTKRA